MAVDPRFFSLTPTSAGDLAQMSGCDNRGDGERMVVNAAPLSRAGEGDLTFLAAAQDTGDMAGLARAVVVTTAAL